MKNSFLLLLGLFAIIIFTACRPKIEMRDDEKTYQAWASDAERVLAQIKNDPDKALGEPSPFLRRRFKDMVARGPTMIPLIRTRLSAYVSKAPGYKEYDRYLAVAAAEIMGWKEEQAELEKSTPAPDSFERAILLKLNKS